MNKVVWGMIGCGSVTEKKSGPALYKCRNSELKAVYNRTNAKAYDWVKRHGHGTVCEDLEALLADRDITAVYIATPPDSHMEYALKVLDAGKIPLIEKPMANSFEECNEILRAAGHKKIPVYVNFYRRGLEKFKKIKELLDSGAVGSVRMVEIRQFMKPEPDDMNIDALPWRVRPEAGGGKEVDMQVHVLDYLAYFFGDLVRMTGIPENRAGYYPVEDTISASMQFKNGVVGSAAWCYAADFDLDEVTILGSEGSLVFEGMGLERAELIKDGNTTEFVFEVPEHVGMPFIQTIVDEISGGGKSQADSKSAANSIKMLDMLLNGYRRCYTDKHAGN